MKARNIIAFLLVLVVAGLLVWWGATGAHIFTSTSHQVPVKDDLFGTVTMKWENELQPGLEFIGSASLLLLIIAGWLALGGRRRRASA